VGHVPRADADRAGTGFLQPGDHPQERRLPAARRADEDAELAVLGLEDAPTDTIHSPAGGTNPRLFLAPGLLMFAIYVIIPIFQSTWISFYEWLASPTLTS
jgi:hypothetical protein